MAKLSITEINAVINTLHDEVKKKITKLPKRTEEQARADFAAYNQVCIDYDAMAKRRQELQRNILSKYKFSSYTNMPVNADTFVKMIEDKDKTSYDWNRLRNDLIVSNISRPNFDIKEIAKSLKKYEIK